MKPPYGGFLFKENIMEDKMILLGATGSIGRQALDVAEKLNIHIVAMTAGSNCEEFEKQIRKFHPSYVAMANENAAKDLKTKIADLDVKVLSGTDGICEIASMDISNTVLNSVSGVAGLLPTLSAINSDHKVALANKETLVRT